MHDFLRNCAPTYGTFSYNGTHMRHITFDMNGCVHLSAVIIIGLLMLFLLVYLHTQDEEHVIFAFLRKTIATLFQVVCLDLVELFNSHRVYPFSLYCTMLRFVTMISLNEDTYLYCWWQFLLLWKIICLLRISLFAQMSLLAAIALAVETILSENRSNMN